MIADRVRNALIRGSRLARENRLEEARAVAADLKRMGGMSAAENLEALIGEIAGGFVCCACEKSVDFVDTNGHCIRCSVEREG